MYTIYYPYEPKSNSAVSLVDNLLRTYIILFVLVWDELCGRYRKMEIRYSNWLHATGLRLYKNMVASSSREINLPNQSIALNLINHYVMLLLAD